MGTTFGAMAFLLFGVIVGVWVRSHVTADSLYASAPPCPVGDYFHTYGLVTWKGRVIASRVRVVSRYAHPEGNFLWDSQPADWAPISYPLDASKTWLGFSA